MMSTTTETSSETNVNEILEWSSFAAAAAEIAKREPLLSNFLVEVVLSCSSFEESISSLLSVCYGGGNNSLLIPISTWKHSIFMPAFSGELGDYNGTPMIDLFLEDLVSIQERDPACTCLVTAFMHFKGFKALQAHRAAHMYWNNGRCDIALAIQSRCSELWAVDIHPNARIGGGLMIDHGTGVVVGETAVIGRNCSFLHNVTLGSTGKESGDRHPKLGDDVLVGCNAIILGNISIGRSAKIGSSSVVLKPIPECCTAVGNPARVIGRSCDANSGKSMDHALDNVVAPCGNLFKNTWKVSPSDGDYSI